MMISLVMIVRDGEATIRRCLESAEPVCGRYVIVDTGSTDRTREIIAEWLQTRDGELHEREWVGFAHNRTEALQLARGTADYLLMLDADHTLHVDGELPDLAADEYMLKVRGSLQWWLPLLLKGDREWRYEGVAHSYLTAHGPVTTGRLDELSIDGGPGATPEKLQRDVELLAADHARNPLNPRTVFYLARSYDDLDQPHEAIHYYRLRASMNGWVQERFYARYRLGVLLGEQVSYWEAAPELLAAAQMLSERAAEPLRAIANLANSIADKTPVPHGEHLFLRPGLYAPAL